MLYNLSGISDRLQHLHHDKRLKSKQLDRLRCRIASLVEWDGESVDPDVHDMIQQTVEDNVETILKDLTSVTIPVANSRQFQEPYTFANYYFRLKVSRQC